MVSLLHFTHIYLTNTGWGEQDATGIIIRAPIYLGYAFSGFFGEFQIRGGHQGHPISFSMRAATSVLLSLHVSLEKICGAASIRRGSIQNTALWVHAVP